jgi:polysaccharide biosynthesis protein PelD
MSRENSPGIVNAGEPPRLLGLRRSAWIEIAVFLTMALAIDFGLLGGRRFAGFEPHPFWLIVLLVAAQYGTLEGMVAAAAATLALLAGNLPESRLSIDGFDYIWLIIGKPLLWFGAAWLFGELRRWHKRREEDLARRLEESTGREEDISEAFAKLSAVKQRLETALAANLQSALTLYEATQAVERLEPREVLNGALDLVEAVMMPEKLSIFVLDGNRLRLVAERGWTSADEYAREIPAESGLFRATIGERRTLTVSRPDDELAMGDQGVLAGPIRTPEGGVEGMIKIESIGFAMLNATSVRSFEALGGWIGASYAKALHHQAVSVVNPETQLLSRGLFERESEFLTRVARRIGFHLSVLEVRLEDEMKADWIGKPEIPALLDGAVRSVLRATDLLFDSARPGRDFAVLMPGTGLEGAGRVAEKLESALEREFARTAPGVRWTVTVRSLHETPAEPVAVGAAGERDSDRETGLAAAPVHRNGTASPGDIENVLRDLRTIMGRLSPAGEADVHA